VVPAGHGSFIATDKLVERRGLASRLVSPLTSVETNKQGLVGLALVVACVLVRVCTGTGTGTSISGLDASP